MEEKEEFFDERKEQTPEIQSDEPPQPPKKKGRVGKILGCVFGTIGFTALGFLGGYFSYDTELRSLKWAKEKIQKDYYYGAEISDKEFYDAVFGGVNGLLDQYSEYLTAREYADTLKDATGEWSGIGLNFYYDESKQETTLLVERTSGNSPAEEAGIVAGTILLGYGKTAESIEVCPSFTAFKDYLGDFKEGETLYLQLRVGENEPYILPIAKQSFVENYVFYRENGTGYTFTGKNALTKTEKPTLALPALGAGAAYIRLTSFNGNAAKQFEEAMSLFKASGRTELILDLRANGGGYMDILCSIASYFTKGGGKRPLVATAKYRRGEKENFYAPQNRYADYFGEGYKIRVLADSGTASASECLIGAMISYGVLDFSDISLSYRAGVAKTYGKGIMQTTVPRLLGYSDAIKLTSAEIFWPNGRCIHGVGVLPTDGAKTVAENVVGDGEIEAAIALFRA